MANLAANHAHSIHTQIARTKSHTTYTQHPPAPLHFHHPATCMSTVTNASKMQKVCICGPSFPDGVLCPSNCLQCQTAETLGWWQGATRPGNRPIYVGAAPRAACCVPPAHSTQKYTVSLLLQFPRIPEVTGSQKPQVSNLPGCRNLAFQLQLRGARTSLSGSQSRCWGMDAGFGERKLILIINALTWCSVTVQGSFSRLDYGILDAYCRACKAIVLQAARCVGSKW